MTRLLLLFSLIAPLLGSTLEPGYPFENWEFICDSSEAVAGLRTFFVNDFTNGTDLRIYVFCRSLSGKKAPRVKALTRDGCYDTEKFIFGVEQFTWSDETRNCKSGEFINGIVSEWIPAEHYRTMQFKCCKLDNAEPDSNCHSVGPSDIFCKTFSHLKTPYEPVSNCPSDILTAMEYSKDGLSLQYCPIKATDGKYDKTKCEEVKTTSVEDGVIIATLEEVLQPLAEVQAETWTEQETGWRIDCGAYYAVNSMKAKFVQIEPGKRDVLVQLTCAPQLVDAAGEHTATKMRYTRYVRLTEFRVAAGCRRDEVMQGIISKYENNTRDISLLCADNANTQLVSSYPYKVMVRRDQEKSMPPEGAQNIDMKHIHSVSFDLKNVADSKIQLIALMTEYEYLEEARFGNSTLLDENSGASMELSPAPQPGESPGSSLAPEAVDVEVDTASIEEMKEGAYSAPGADFRFDCGSYMGLERLGVRQVDFEGQADHSFSYTCKEVTAEQSVALKTRILKFQNFKTLNPALACGGEDEYIQGMVGIFEEGARLISITCAEQSNLFKKEERAEVGELTGEGQEFITVEEGEAVGNIGASSLTSSIRFARSVDRVRRKRDALEGSVTHKLLEFTSDPKFGECIVVDEIKGTEEVVKCLPKGVSPEDGLCEDGVLSRFFNDDTCPDNCEGDCQSWSKGVEFGQFKSATCQKNGGDADKCLCEFEHPQGTCDYPQIPKEGCVCLCNKVCHKQNDTTTGEGPGGEPGVEGGFPCGLGVAYKWLPEPEPCTSNKGCMSKCSGWAPGNAFGEMLTAECKVDLNSDPEGHEHCYCEYENLCAEDEGAGEECEDGVLSKTFGYSHCPDDCERRCSTWVPGMLFGNVSKSECGPKDEDATRDSCICEFTNLDGSCEIPTLPPTTASPTGEDIDGTFGEVRVETRRRLKRAPPMNEHETDDLRVYEDLESGTVRWIVLPTNALRVCPEQLCNCGPVCEDLDALASDKGGDGEGGAAGGEGETIEGSFGSVNVAKP